MSMVEINFSLAPWTFQLGDVFVWRVDPTSKQENLLGSFQQSSVTITQYASPGTEWRFNASGVPTPFQTYVTTADLRQFVDISPSKQFVDLVRSPPGVVVTDAQLRKAMVTSPIEAVVTPGVTVTVTPGVSISGTPSDPSISVGSTTTPPPGVTVMGARGSIFTAPRESQSFDMNVINLEYAIRQQSGLTDNNQLRAAIYAKLVEIAKAPHRTRDEQAVIDWLARQVKQTRVEAARLALEEYDKWNRNPHGYIPPQGYDFPAYVIPPARSRQWLTTTPPPPVLANKSLLSFFAEIISSNGWSPLNNPLLTKGQRNTSLENVIGFPVFGTARAYEKLYGSGEGAWVLAETTANLSWRSFTLTPGAATIASPFSIRTAYQLNFPRISPFGQRNMDVIVDQFARWAGKPNIVTVPDPVDAKLNMFINQVQNMSKNQLRTIFEKVTSGEILSGFVASFICTIALMEIISESMMLADKIKLRGELVAKLEKQQSDPLPDPRNLFYYDGEWREGTGWVQRVLADDYQPTDPVELERLMGSREAYRAFLLATL